MNVKDCELFVRMKKRAIKDGLLLGTTEDMLNEQIIFVINHNNRLKKELMWE